jgi:hypothetical protein
MLHNGNMGWRQRRRDEPMAINRFLAIDKLRPDQVERLNKAFTFAPRSLYLVNRNDPVADIIAKKSLRSRQLAFAIQKRLLRSDSLA